MTYKTIVMIILSVSVLASIGDAQINRSSIEEYIENVSIDQASYDLYNKTPEMIKNISLDILKINSSDIQNLSNRSIQMLANVTLNEDDITDLSKDLAPRIELDDVHTDIGTPDLLGYHPDCTFTLNNSGDIDGVAIVNFETDNQILKKKSFFLVPAKTVRKFNEKIDIPLLSFGRISIICYIECQRKASTMDYYDRTIRKN